MKYSISDFYTYNFFPEIDLDKIKSIFGTMNMLVSTKGCCKHLAKQKQYFHHY